MIRLTNVSLSFGAQFIFNNMSWQLRPGERVGLVGPNGAGKTTLLQILLGRQSIDTGTIRRAKNTETGYLPQDRISLAGKPLLEETLTAFDSVLKLEREIHELQNKIDTAAKSGKDTTDLLNRLGKIQHLFEQADGYRLESEAKKILKGLGFTEEDWQRETSTFSGGWQMRIALAKLLLQRPNLLMLDEPTNHLDVQTTEWLENYLQNYDGAFILVSHDRYFLDRTVKKIVSLERGSLHIYHGNYTRFEQERKKQIEVQWSEYYRQKEEVERIRKFIDRFRYKATKAAQVQSRIKMLDKMTQLEPPEAESHVSFHFPPAPASGKLLVAAENVAKSFTGKQVFANISFRCDRGERIAIVGVNGAGKSTLCRILAGIDTDHAGEIFKDSRLKIGYYSQDIADRFSDDTTVLTEAQAHAETMPPKQVRNVLGAFLFSGDDVNKPTKILSGGEKSRLALACILFQSANLLILDEPTNHLDLQSKNVLSEALNSFDGGIILVSHDRYFLDKIVNRVIEISHGEIRQFWGNYTDYLQKKETERMPAAETAELQSSLTNLKDNEPDNGRKKTRQQRRLEAEQRNQRFQLRKEHEIRLQELEAEIEKTEREKEILENRLADPATFKKSDGVQQLQVDFHATAKKLQQLYKQWETIAEKIEEINSGLNEE